MKIVHKDDYNKNRWMNKDLTRLQQHHNKSINQILNFGLHTSTMMLTNFYKMFYDNKNK